MRIDLQPINDIGFTAYYNELNKLPKQDRLIAQENLINYIKTFQDIIHRACTATKNGKYALKVDSTLKRYQGVPSLFLISRQQKGDLQLMIVFRNTKTFKTGYDVDANKLNKSRISGDVGSYK